MTSIPTYDLYGEKRREKADFWLHCETIPSRSSLYRWEIRLHRHEGFFQILYIDAGSGDVTFGSETHSIRPPAVVTVPPGLNHGFRFSRDVDGFVITVLPSHLKAVPGDRSRLGAWLARPHLLPLDMGNADCAHVGQTLRRLGEEFGSTNAGRNDLLEAYLTAALLLAARISWQGEGQAAASSETERRMERLNDLLHRHIRSHEPVAFYAAQLGMSPTHLSRLVRSVTGHGMQELIARRLLDEARRELVFTFGTIQEIAFRLGFSDPAYFSRFFLRETGATPRDWRMRQRADLGQAAS